MKQICRMVFLFVLFLFLFSFISGCKSTTVISTNQYIQTDYNYQCLDESKTFTQIILCYQAQDQAEKTQNKITNEMIKKSSKK